MIVNFNPMKKIISILLAFMLSLFVVNGQRENISRLMSPGDSLTVNVKFERVKLSKDELTVQDQINTLLINSVKTTDMLAEGINRLTSALEQNVQLSQLSKADIVADQLGIERKEFNKYYKRNNTFLLICLLPMLLLSMYAMVKFSRQRGLDIKHLIAGTAVMALYGILLSGVLYVFLSLIFNKEFFIIKNLMASMF